MSRFNLFNLTDAKEKQRLVGIIQLTLGGVSSYLINLVTTGAATTSAEDGISGGVNTY